MFMPPPGEALFPSRGATVRDRTIPTYRRLMAVGHEALCLDCEAIVQTLARRTDIDIILGVLPAGRFSAMFKRYGGV